MAGQTHRIYRSAPQDLIGGLVVARTYVRDEKVAWIAIRRQARQQFGETRRRSEDAPVPNGDALPGVTPLQLGLVAEEPALARLEFLEALEIQRGE